MLDSMSMFQFSTRNHLVLVAQVKLLEVSLFPQYSYSTKAFLFPEPEKLLSFGQNTKAQIFLVKRHSQKKVGSISQKTFDFPSILESQHSLIQDEKEYFSSKRRNHPPLQEANQQESCPPGTFNEGIHGSCLICPPGFYCVDGKKRTCSSKPMDVNETEYFVAGISFPECPWRCLAKYKFADGRKCSPIPVGMTAMNGGPGLFPCMSHFVPTVHPCCSLL